MKRLIKKTFLSAATLFLAACIFDSNDEEKWDASKVCPENGMNSYGIPNRGSFVDERDGQVYKYTTIGNQVWMAENLRFNAPYSMCCNDADFLKQYCELIEHNCSTELCCMESMCNKFGRYYSINENGNRFGLVDTDLADTICPKGWHLPTIEEWEKLKNAMKVDGENETTVATRMKSSDSNYFVISKEYTHIDAKMEKGTDDCSLNILPYGHMISDGGYYNTGAYFLSSAQTKADELEVFRIASNIDFFFQGYRDAIRCVMNTVNPEL